MYVNMHKYDIYLETSVYLMIDHSEETAQEEGGGGGGGVYSYSSDTVEGPRAPAVRWGRRRRRRRRVFMYRN
jgi:hypothetical protein